MKSKPVGAVLNALRILEYLGAQSAPVSVTNAARSLAISPSTCFTILRTLAQQNYVSFDDLNKSYAIGSAVIDLASKANKLGRDISHARQQLEAVSNQHKVTITLWRQVTPDRRMLVFEVTPLGDMSVFMKLGQRLPLLGGAAGRVMAAYSDLTAGELRSQFKEIRWVRPTSFKQFMQEVAEARDRGWVADCGEFFAGMASIAAPVFDSEGKLGLVCTSTMFVHSYTPQRAKAIAKSLTTVSKSILRP